MKKKVKFQQPEPFQPTEKEDLEVIMIVAKMVSKAKEIQSINNPAIKVSGEL